MDTPRHPLVRTCTRLSKSLALALLGIGTLVFLSEEARAFCAMPSGLTTLSITVDGAQLRWTSNEGIAASANNCADITVERRTPQATWETAATASVCYGQGFASPIVSFRKVNSQVTVGIGGLLPGESYRWFVREHCNNPPPLDQPSAYSGPEMFETFDAQFMVSSTSTRPTCSGEASGSLTLSVTDGNTCDGTYSVSVSPNAGSGPNGSTPPLPQVTTYIGFPEGSFPISGASTGCYTITVVETGPCNPEVDPVIIVACVPDAQDMIPPTLVCPADIVVAHQAPDACPVIEFDTPVPTDNCPGIGAPTQIFGPSSGFLAAAQDSPWQVFFEVQDSGGNISRCSFSITFSTSATSDPCDGTDNNCNGDIDEDAPWYQPGQNDLCDTDYAGTCSTGRLYCDSGGATLCEPDELPSASNTPAECLVPGGQVFFGMVHVPGAGAGTLVTKSFRCVVASAGATPVCDSVNGELVLSDPMCF